MQHNMITGLIALFVVLSIGTLAALWADRRNLTIKSLFRLLLYTIKEVVITVSFGIAIILGIALLGSFLNFLWRLLNV